MHCFVAARTVPRNKEEKRLIAVLPPCGVGEFANHRDGRPHQAIQALCAAYRALPRSALRCFLGPVPGPRINRVGDCRAEGRFARARLAAQGIWKRGR